MKFKIITILLLIIFLPFLAGAAPLTLEQCIEQGLAYNPDVEIYRLSVDEETEAVHEAWGAFLPTLSASYNYSELSNSGKREFDKDYLDQNSDSLSLRLSQPLFTGFAGVAGVKRAHLSREYREIEFRYMKQQLVQEVSTSFYNCVLNQQLVEKWRESITRLEQQSDIVTAWVKQELASRLRLLAVNVELSNARHELIRVQSELDISKARLRQWLNLDPLQDLQLSGDLISHYDNLSLTLEDYLTAALEQRLELQLSKLQIGMAEQDVKSILARNLPQAKIDATWVDYHREYDVSTRYPDEDRSYYGVYFNLSISPFQGGRNLSAWRRQKIAVNRYRQQLIKQRHAITTDVEIRYQQLTESRARISNAKDTLAEATQAYQFSLKSAELGVVSIADVLDAELRLSRAEVNLIDSKYALQMATVQLNYAVGGGDI